MHKPQCNPGFYLDDNCMCVNLNNRKSNKRKTNKSKSNLVRTTSDQLINRKSNKKTRLNETTSINETTLGSETTLNSDKNTGLATSSLNQSINRSSNNAKSGITLERFKKITEKYGNMSSWAVWKRIEEDQPPKKGMGDISFFENPSKKLLKTLNPNIVLVSLNISKGIPRVFGNWHPDYSSAQDYKLRYALQDTPFWGSYMTDIIKNHPEMDSKKLIDDLKKTPGLAQKNIDNFIQELKDIGAKNPILIAQGGATFKILKKYLKDKYRIFKVTHYSAFMKKEQLREEYNNLIEIL